MRQRIACHPIGDRTQLTRGTNWRPVLMGCALLATLACAARPVSASDGARTEQTAPGSSGTSAPEPPSEAPELPMLLLVVKRPAKEAPRRDDPVIGLQDALRGVLRESGRFQGVLYSPTNPLVKRAILEHSIAVSDLEEPLKPEALERVAHAIGAHTLLILTATYSPSGMKADIRLEESMGQQDWRVSVSDLMSVDAVFNKHRLKQAEVVALTADMVAQRLGIPSHLGADMHIKEHTLVLAPNEPAKPPKGKKAAGPAAPVQPAPTAGSEASTSSPANTTEAAQSSSPSRLTTEGPAPQRRPDAEPGSTVVEHGPGKTGSKPRGKGPTPANAALLPAGPPAEAPHTTPVLAAPAPAPDYSTLAAHFHDAGDTASQIVFLRRAINDHPRDAGLRAALAQAYQDRQMPDAAAAEVVRALSLVPDDPDLLRVYGGLLLAQGNVQGAEKAYRDVLVRTPQDTRTQVALGDALRLDNQFADSAAAYEAAAKTDPKLALPHRRLALAMLERAAADPARYGASLAEAKLARELAVATGSQDYAADYPVLMTLVGKRLRDTIDEMNGNFSARLQGKVSVNDLVRVCSDLKVRGEALTDYLDKLPVAAGQDATHIHFQQSGALMLQAISLLRSYALGGDDATIQAMKDARLEAMREIETAQKRMTAVRSSLDTTAGK